MLLEYVRVDRSGYSRAEELDQALAMVDAHMSIYQLTLHKGTPLYRLVQYAYHPVSPPQAFLLLGNMHQG